MPRKKRPYDPKIKGCTPCARRRIHCDLRGPICRKCESRNIRCTGLTLELRTGIPDPHESAQAETARFIPQHEEISNAYRCNTQNSKLPLNVQSWSQDGYSMPVSGQGESVSVPPTWLLPDDSYCASDDNHHGADGELYTSANAQLDKSMAITARPVSLRLPLTDPLASWKRQMCLHFSTYIATEMVAVDGPYNNWRHLLLPFAHYDDLVLQAIISVSSCHIHLVNSVQTTDQSLAVSSGSRPTFDSFPAEFHRMYQNIFSNLRLGSDMRQLPIDKKNSILMTILVLLTGAMVTGRSDFPLFYGLLGSAFDAMGGIETFGGSDIAYFIRSQVAKFRFYGATMIDEQAGLQFISSSTHVQELLDSLSRQWSDHPEHNATVLYVNDLTRQALDMYLEQAQAASSTTCPAGEDATDDNSLTSIVRIQHFIETLQSLPPSASCEQVLIWATFVAASGCVLDEHIQFFENVLRRHYARNKFLNVLAGLESLHKIWARNRSEKWTSLIAQTRTLVM